MKLFWGKELLITRTTSCVVHRISQCLNLQAPCKSTHPTWYHMTIRHNNNIPAMQLFTEISRNTCKSYMVSLMECVSEIMYWGILIEHALFPAEYSFIPHLITGTCKSNNDLKLIKGSMSQSKEFERLSNSLLWDKVFKLVMIIALQTFFHHVS